MSERLVWTSRETAAAIGLALDTFYQRVAYLRREHGFPDPLPGLRSYDPVAVRAWIARQRAPEDNAEAPIDSVLIARAHVMLPPEQQAGG